MSHAEITEISKLVIFKKRLKKYWYQNQIKRERRGVKQKLWSLPEDERLISLICIETVSWIESYERKIKEQISGLDDDFAWYASA